MASICSRLIGCIVLGVAITFLGCEKKKAAPPSFPPPLVTITKPVVTKVQNYHEYNGNLEAIETVQVQARVKGFLNEIAFTEGDEVKKGALLFKIDPREYMSAVKKAEADFRKA
ncbi:biotin/lipoyl-binding protein, partial [bacterium]|nr:biotin/lipoyl-binding protein [bacterium]